MPRAARIAPGGYVYHVLNRGVGQMTLFTNPADYEMFFDVLGETLAKLPMRIAAFTLMPDHWHFVVWPEEDGQLGRFFQRLTGTHVARWTQAKHRVGLGHVYQGRFKSFPVQTDDHFYQVVRYVERNALRADLVAKATDWPWSSLGIRTHGTKEQRDLLATWPVRRPRDWLRYVNRREPKAELTALRLSVQRGAPYGDEGWVATTAEELGLQSSLRPRGRPRKST